MNVDYIKPEVAELLPLYKMIRDVLRGPAAMKRGGYILNPDPTDQSPAGIARYNNYSDRAVFFDATARTHEGFLGQMFYREMQVEVPDLLMVMMEDVDGEGSTLEQQAKNVAGEVLAMGRAGLYVDYSTPVDGQATLADQQNGKVRPTITMYIPDRIINWRFTTVGNNKFLSLVVLQEDAYDEDDGFEAEVVEQWRELRMVPKDIGASEYILMVRIWRKTSDGLVVYGEPTFPTKGNGKNWDRIPFEFIGSVDNDPTIDKPPMEGMAHVNVAHYRNSADYEESVHMLGQPTPWASGITENWLAEAWDGELRLGCRGFIPLPEGGQMGLLQVSPNTMAKEAMEQKERQLVALGAKLAEAKAVQTTATEEQRDAVLENSTLSSVAKNCSSAYRNALRHCCEYAGVDVAGVVMELNTDFEITRMSAQDRQQLLLEWQGGGITWEEYRWNMKRSGVAFEDDAKAKRTIQADLADAIDLGDDNGQGNKEPTENT